MGVASSLLTISTGFLDRLQITWRTPLWRTASLHALTMAAASVFFVLALAVGHDDYAGRAVQGGSLVLTLISATRSGWRAR